MTHQTTLAKQIKFEGAGLHGGKEVRMSIEPAGGGRGIVFAVSGAEIPARVENVKSTARRTELSAGGQSVHTVEHVLSALTGMGVDNATVVMDAPEPPALDGSAREIAEAISETGLAETDARVEFLEPAEPIVTGTGDSFVTVLPSKRFQATFILGYDHPMISMQAAHFGGDSEEYLKEVAPARTYGFIEEVEALREAGLALGGSEENAIVIYPDRYSAELRFENEFARHKLLDLVGDAGLAWPARPRAHFIGVRSGHGLNVEAVRMLLSSPGK